MSKRMTAIAATALALAFGCEEGMGVNEEAEIGEDQQERAQGERQEAMEQEQQAQREQQEAQQAEQQARREEEQQQETQFNQGPGVGIEEEDEPIAQGTPQQRQMEQQRLQQQRMQQQRQMGQQGQMGQQQQLGQAGTPGQVVTTPSERNFNQTIAQLTRQMRQNDLEIIGQVRYDERMRQRLMREHEQQAQAGQTARMGQQAQGGQQPAAQGEIGDVRLLVFRRPDSEVMSIENQGAEALLDAPRAVLVYERGEEVIVAYRAPEQMAAVGEEEPTSELLARVVRDATQPAQQPTAQREQVEEEEPIAQREQRGEELPGETSEGMDVDVSVSDERQARAPN